MARPQRRRRICREPEYRQFQPDGIGAGEEVNLTCDEFEIIRLVDHLGLTREQASKRMDISRTTATEVYESARRKIAEAIVLGKCLTIGGGSYRLCPGDGCANACGPSVPPTPEQPKGEEIMRIAVTYDNGAIFQHFGHTEQFKVYDIENGKVVASEVIDTNGSGHGALAGVLTALNADALICGGIGGGAQMALAAAGIRLFGGVSGNADAAVEALLSGTLDFNPNVKCNHHDHHHGEGHTCGDHGCGSHNCGHH